jgi:hypothetical protein
MNPKGGGACPKISKLKNNKFDVFLTVHHSIELFHLPTNSKKQQFCRHIFT